MIRASVPKLNLDDAFEQKNEIAKAVEVELEKVAMSKTVDHHQHQHYSDENVLIGNICRLCLRMAMRLCRL